MDFSEKTPKGIDKVERYNWVMQDSPGEFRWIDKNLINVDHGYQRSDVSLQKIAAITSSWRWVSCGTITVADRGGEVWAIDGQHRVLAAQRRSDILALPCLVFKTTGTKQEAQGFLDINTARKPVAARHRHKAAVVAGDPVAVYIQEELSRLGLSTTRDDQSPGYFSCLAWAMATAQESKDTFSTVLEVVADLCIGEGSRITEVLVSGLTYIHKNHSGGIREKRIAEKIKARGPLALHIAAKRKALLTASGGSKVWASGILDEINKGLSKKIVIKGLNDA